MHIPIEMRRELSKNIVKVQNSASDWSCLANQIADEVKIEDAINFDTSSVHGPDLDFDLQEPVSPIRETEERENDIVDSLCDVSMSS